MPVFLLLSTGSQFGTHNLLVYQRDRQTDTQRETERARERERRGNERKRHRKEFATVGKRKEKTHDGNRKAGRLKEKEVMNSSIDK